MADVEQDQLPAALALRPDLASLVIGINDTLRADFSLDAFAAAAARTVGSLHAAGATVLTMRLPDPGQMLGIPGVLARPLARRAREINAVMDGLHARHGTVHFDAARDPQTYDRQMWAADRLHPSERGHRHVARRFHGLLAEAGHPVGAEPSRSPENPPPGRLAVAGWLATKGTAWVVRAVHRPGARAGRDGLGGVPVRRRRWWRGWPCGRSARRGSATGSPGSLARRPRTTAPA